MDASIPGAVDCPRLLGVGLTKGVGSVSRTKRGKTMKTARMTFVSTVVAAAFGLMLGLIGAPGNSFACHVGTKHKAPMGDCAPIPSPSQRRCECWYLKWMSG